MQKRHNAAAATAVAPPSGRKKATARRRSQDLFDPATRLGRLMLSLDWSGTALGSPETWPESLRTPVRMMQASGAPMFIWWGPDLINLYNDACAELFGRRMTSPAVGLPASEVRNEIWSAIGPEVVEVMLGKGAASHRERLLVAERNGRLEERHISFTLSPILGDRGAPLGVLGACSDDTAAVLSRRRLRTLRALTPSLLLAPVVPLGAVDAVDAARAAAAALAANAHDVPFALIYLLGPERSDGDPHGGSGEIEEQVLLAASAGSLPDQLAGSLTLGGTDAPWPLAQAAEAATQANQAVTDAVTEPVTRAVVTDSGMIFTDVLPQEFAGCTAGVWGEPAAGAVVLALESDTASTRPAGFVILGVSPRLPLDEDYRDFLDLAANRVAAALRKVRREERKRRPAASVQQKEDEQKDEFLAMLAHELRNPLAPIRSATELLKYVDKSPRSLSNAREIIERQLTHLVRLMDDLLDVSRISRGKLVLRKELVDLRAAARNAVESAAPSIREAGHDLAIALPQEPVAVNGDATRLSQVIENLLVNAAQYTEGGGHITLLMERRGDTALIRVRDDGIGITSAMLPRIFDMFTQAEQRGDGPRRGLGIGLTIAQRLVEMHGGAIAVQSAGEGCGSEFTVSLPLIAPQRAHSSDYPDRDDAHAGAKRPLPILAGTTQSAAHANGGSSNGAKDRSRRRILVADDNKDAAVAIAEILGTIGHQVRTAEDGLEAVELAETFRPDLILLDLGMPRLDGYEACRRIRQRAWGRDVAIYAVTGWGQASDRRRTREAGFNAHLVKPVAFAAIESLISSH